MTPDPTSSSALPQLRPGLLLLVTLVTLAAGACKGGNPSYCDQATGCDDGFTCDLARHRCVENVSPCLDVSDCTDPSAPLCVEGICRECATSADCTAEAPHCSGAPEHVCTGCAKRDDCADFAEAQLCASDGRCVGCTSELDCARGDACDPDEGQCRPCTTHRDCESLVCRVAEGTCAVPAEVVFVSPDGLDQPGCTREAPCATLAHGRRQLSAGRPYLHLAAGRYDETLELADTGFVLIAEAGAELHGAEPDRPVLLLSGGMLEIDGLTVVGHSASTSDGIQVTGGRHQLRAMTIREHGGNGLVVSGDSELSLVDSSAVANHQSGLAVLGGTAKVLRAAFDRNAALGASATGGQLELQASSIAENQTGGLFARNSQIDLVNCLVHHNTSTAFAPVHFAINSSSGSARVVHTTIVANQSGDSDTSGVRCGGTFQVFLRNDIIHGNDGPMRTVAGCTITYSLLGPAVEAGEGNILGAPRFLDLEAGDLHLVSDSVGVDDGTSGDADVDLDGEPRPMGLAPDVGADEVRPSGHAQSGRIGPDERPTR